MRRNRLSANEREIDDIKKRAEEYRKLIQIQLEYEKNKTVGAIDEKKISELEGKLKQSGEEERRDIEKATDNRGGKEREKLRKYESERSARKLTEQEDDRIDKNFRKSEKTGIDFLSGMLKNYVKAAAEALEQYQLVRFQAESDGVITNEEQGGIDRAFEAYQMKASRQDDLERRLQQARGSWQEKSNRSMAFGGFNSAELTGLFNRNGLGSISQEERKMKYAEETAKNTKDLNKTLQGLNVRTA